MNVEKQALLFGIDITNYVQTWGTLERLKNMILGQDTIFSSEHSLEVANLKGWANLAGPGSVMKGVDWSGKDIIINFGGNVAFKGIVIDIKPDPSKRTATIVAQNVLKKPAESIFTRTAPRQNPALAALAALRTCMSDDEIDVRSFQSAGARYSSAGAFVDLAFEVDAGTTVLQALQSLTNLASFAIVENGGVASCQPFFPYQGDEAGLRWEVTDALVRSWSTEERDETAYTNRVAVGYPTNLTAILDDLESQRTNANIRDFQFPATGDVVASDLVSARFFGKLYLSRASLKRTKIGASVGHQAYDAMLGDRHPVSPSGTGRERLPMEAIGVTQDLDANATSMSFAQLA